jgi:hypothetical protein
VGVLVGGGTGVSLGAAGVLVAVLVGGTLVEPPGRLHALRLAVSAKMINPNNSFLLILSSGM